MARKSRQTRTLTSTIIGKLRRNENRRCWEGYINLPSWKDCYVRWKICDGEVAVRKDRRGKREKQGIFPLTVEDEAGAGPSPAQERAYSLLKDNEKIICQILLVELAAFVKGRYFDWA